MASSNKQLNGVNPDTKLLVSGFIRSIKGIMTYWTVPQEIIDQCILYYHLELLWDLSGISREDSRTICNITNGWRTAPLNQAITSKMCNIFEIEMKCIKSLPEIIGIFYGFFKNDLSDLVRNMQLTVKPNTEYIFICGTTVSNANNVPVGKLSRHIGESDSIKMVFDFRKNECKWFVNFQDGAIMTEPIDADAVIPAFSFFWTSVTFELVNFAFK